jgi:hypothetical protein
MYENLSGPHKGSSSLIAAPNASSASEQPPLLLLPLLSSSSEEEEAAAAEASWSGEQLALRPPLCPGSGDGGGSLTWPRLYVRTRTRPRHGRQERAAREIIKKEVCRSSCNKGLSIYKLCQSRPAPL